MNTKKPKSWEEYFNHAWYLHHYDEVNKNFITVGEDVKDFIRNQIRAERLEVYKDIYKKFDNSPLAPADFLFWLSETIGQIEKHDE